MANIASIFIPRLKLISKISYMNLVVRLNTKTMLFPSFQRMRCIGTSAVPQKPCYIATVVKTQEKNWLQCLCQRDKVGHEDICSQVTKV